MGHSRLATTVGLLLGSISLLQNLTLSAAQAYPTQASNLPSNPASNDFDPPPEQDRPTQTTGGGSRNGGRCIHDPLTRTPFTALSVPEPRTGSFNAPSAIQVQIPSTTAERAEFSIFDVNGNGIYQRSLPLTGGTGTLHISLPMAEPTLQAGQEYQWVVALVCEPSDRLQDQFISGWMQIPLTSPLADPNVLSRNVLSRNP